MKNLIKLCLVALMSVSTALPRIGKESPPRGSDRTGDREETHHE